MAGNWLQIDCDLPEKPETQRICDATGLGVDVVVGRLVMFWRWVDRHTTSKNVRHMSVETLCRVAGGDLAFWKSVSDVGWLSVTESGLEIPGWQKRFSKSAKTRMLDAKRKAEKRLDSVRQQPDKKRTTPGPKEEKRRVEKNKEEKKNKDSCPESEIPTSGPQDAAVALLTFQTDGSPRTWGLTQPFVDTLAAAFPNLDILAEARRALAWVESNPSNRKTASGMKRFLNGWMGKSQNAPTATARVNGARPAPDYSLKALGLDYSDDK